MSIGGGSDDLSPQQLMEAANNWAKRNAFSPEQLQVLCVVMVYGWKMDFNTPHRCSYTSNALTHTHVRTHTHTHKRTYTHTHTYARQTHRTRGATPDPVHVTHTHECAGIHTPQHDGGGLVTHCNTCNALQHTATGVRASHHNGGGHVHSALANHRVPAARPGLFRHDLQCGL